MDDSWQFGDAAISYGGRPGISRDELEYVLAEDDVGLLEAMEDQQLINMIAFTCVKEPSGPTTWTLNAITKELSLDHGYFITVRAVQMLRKKREGPVLLGIGGPSGSGKSSLAERLAQVLGGKVIDLENYFNQRVKDDTYDIKSFDFPLLRQHLQALLAGETIKMPVFDWLEKKRTKFVPMELPASGVILLEGVYALSKDVRPLLDIAVAVVGGVHYNLLQKVAADVRKSGGEKSLAGVMDSIFPLFRTQIEPDLATAQIRISNKFVADSLREPVYIMKTTKLASKEAIKEVLGVEKRQRHRTDKFLDMYLKSPGDNVRMKDLIRVRQVGSRYFYTEGNQRIVDRHTIIRPGFEFEVGKTTLGGLLACNYEVFVSFKRESDVCETDDLVISIDTIVMKTEPERQQEVILQVRGKNRQMVQAAAEALTAEGPWITKSYMELVLEARGLPRIPSPPLSASGMAMMRPVTPPPAAASEGSLDAPRPIRLRPTSPGNAYLAEPWTRSPTQAQLMEPVVGSWHLTSLTESSGVQQPEPEGAGPSGSWPYQSREEASGQAAIQSPRGDAVEASMSVMEPAPAGQLRVELVPKMDVFNFDHGLNLAVSATQTLLRENGSPVIIGIGGPSGSGKTTFSRKLANLIECQLISLENYYKEDQVDDTNYDEFSTLDSSLLLQNIRDFKDLLQARTPVFDFQTKMRVGFNEVKLSRESGVVIVEGIYALHPYFQHLLDIRIAVVGGVHSHLAARVHRDLERSGRRISQNDVIQTVFPMFREHIEPHLASAHLKIVNNFDPVHSHENAVFVLKSPKEAKIDEIAKVLNPRRSTRIFRSFTDSYFYLPGLDRNGPSCEGDFIRVRDCGTRFAVLIREPIREGDFIIQSQVDFDVSIKTVGGLSKLGYKTAAIIEVNATLHQDDQLSIEVDHLPRISRSYIQVKGSNKEAVAAAGAKLQLEGTYTTLPYFEILQSTNRVALTESVDAVHSPPAAKLQELVLRANGQGQDDRSLTAGGSASPINLATSMRSCLEDMEARLSRMEQLQTYNLAATTLILIGASAFLVYQSVYKQR